MTVLLRLLSGSAVAATVYAAMAVKGGRWTDMFAWAFVALLASACAGAVAEKVEANRQDEADRHALDPSIPFVLLLRPFSVDSALTTLDPHHSGNILNAESHYTQEEIFVHTVLRRAVEPRLRVVQLGGKAVGVGRVVVDDWKPVFSDLAGAARAIVVIAMPGQETLWECEQIKLNEWLEKTVFLVPPFPPNSDPARAAFHRRLASVGLTLPSDPKDYTLAHLDQDGRVVAHYEMLADLSYRTLRKALKLTVFGSASRRL